MKTALATISAAVSLVLLFSGEALADSVEDKLDRAGDAYEAAEAKAALDFRNAFVGQIKALTKSRNFDAVQQLRAEQAAFDSFSLVLPPNDTVMRAAVGRYQAATVAAEVELRVAYESAAKRYSIEHGLDQRLVPEDDYEGIQPPPIRFWINRTWQDRTSVISCRRRGPGLSPLSMQKQSWLKVGATWMAIVISWASWWT